MNELARPVVHFARQVIVKRHAIELGVLNGADLRRVVEESTVRSIERSGYGVLGSVANLRVVERTDVDELRRHRTLHAGDYLVDVDVEAYELPACAGCGAPIMPCDRDHAAWELCGGWRHSHPDDPVLSHSIVCATSGTDDDRGWSIARPASA